MKIFVSNSNAFEIDHKYGSNVHILNNIFLNGLLARLCSPETVQPEINSLVHMLYEDLVISVMNREFPRELFNRPTRMTAIHPEVELSSQTLKKSQRAVVVNLARAGTWPSHICYNTLHYAVEPRGLRQDHIFASRLTTKHTTEKGEHHQVTGTDLSASKIGGDVQDSIVLFPDPMGATGNTIISAIDHYKRQVPGQAHKMIALHLIITPEYLKNVLAAHPDVIIYALRLDRGLSSQAVLDSLPGTHWDQEKGLNQNDYIVPGGGGFGEIMNNSFV
jgi:uracil phosphoribosyltransferase